MEQQEENQQEDGEIGIFHNLIKLNAIPLNNLWGIQTAQRDAIEGFSSQYKSIRLLSRYGLCVFY